MNSQMNDAGRLRHRKAAATHSIPQDPGYHHQQACGPSSFSPRAPYMRQNQHQHNQAHHQYSSSQSSSVSPPCQFHTPPEFSSHARSQSYSNPYQQRHVPNSQRHSSPNRQIYTPGQPQKRPQQQRYGPENLTSENMAPKRSSTQKTNNSSQSTQEELPAILKLTSVLATIATLPGKKVARAAKKLYSYPRNSISDPDLTDISGQQQPGRTKGGRRNGGTCPGTPPPDYDAAMESDVEGDSDFEASTGLENGGGEIDRRQEGALMVDENEISRKFAKQGHHLLTLSLAEIDNNGQTSTSTALASLDQSSFSSSFTRQLYVHSLTYLLRALPQSLTIEEVAGITSALPEAVVDSISYQESLHNQHNHHCCCHQVIELPPATLPKHPTLHKLAMLSASSMVTVMRSLTPHLKLLILQLWLFCQRHRLAERGVDMMKNCGDYGLWASGILLQWLDIQGLLTDAVTTEESQTEVELQGSVDDGGEVVVSGAAVNRNTTVRRRIVRGGTQAGGKAIRDMSSWVGGVVSSSVSGVVDGINAGMEKEL